MTIRYEQAGLPDIAQLIELRLAYLTDDFGELSAESRAALPAEINQYLLQHLGKDLLVFAARDENGRIAACAWLLLVNKPPSPRFPRGRTGILFNVFTERNHRRQGLARNVMHQLLNEARAIDLDVIELHATDDGYPLYLSLGFADDSSTHKAMRFVL